MRRELERHAPGITYAVLNPIHKRHVNPIAGHNIAPGLSDADYRPGTLQLAACDSAITETLEIDGGLAWLRLIVKPDFAAKPVFPFIAHCISNLLKVT
jgi:hypothetical protein